MENPPTQDVVSRDSLEVGLGKSDIARSDFPLTGPAADLEWINDYVGVPYRHNGRDRSGWDCWGLVLAVYRDRLELALPDWRWDEPFDLSAKLRAFAAAFDQVEPGAALELAAPEPFAIALVCHQGRAWPHHVGVVAGAGVLHAANAYGGTVYEPLPRFQKTYPGVTWWRWHRSHS